jgi:chemotaxis protein MotB
MAVEEDPPASIPEWIVTFGDMMSLLLTFFIMLVSMSEIKKDEQFQAMVESMRKRFGHDFNVASLVPGNSRKNSNFDGLASMGRAKRLNLANGGDKVKAPVGENPRVRTIRSGDIPTVGGVIYFAEGQTELTENEKQQLQIVVEEVGGKPQKLEIRGHTSRLPAALKSVEKDMQGRFVDNWHLAYTRCHHVMEFLVSLGIDPARIRLSVAGEYEPVYTGIDPLQRQKNERVEVLMLNERVPEQDVSDNRLPVGDAQSPPQAVNAPAE